MIEHIRVLSIMIYFVIFFVYFAAYHAYDVPVIRGIEARSVEPSTANMFTQRVLNDL
jgi:hypothetical protein